MEYVIFTLSGVATAYLLYLNDKTKTDKAKRIQLELKYQHHLRNAFDYQIQMYAFMAEHNADGFKLASEQVSEELNKCEQILKEK